MVGTSECVCREDPVHNACQCECAVCVQRLKRGKTFTLPRLRVVATPELLPDGKECWVAQCLDLDIATQAATYEDVVMEVYSNLIAQIMVAKHLGKADPFDIPPAPQDVHGLYARVEKLSG